MRIQETLFVADRVVGLLMMETDTQTISFHPANGESRLPERNWESAEELRQAAIAAYRKVESPPVNDGHPKPSQGLAAKRMSDL
jgi:hypothetical protein